MANYYLRGYTPPSTVTNKDSVKQIQQQLGVKADGVWGPKTDAAFRAAVQTAAQGTATQSASYQNTQSGTRTSAYTTPAYTAGRTNSGYAGSGYAGNGYAGNGYGNYNSSASGSSGAAFGQASYPVSPSAITGQYRPVSSAPVKNASRAIATDDADTMSRVQHALRYYAPDLEVTGRYDSATAAAFEKYGNLALYSQYMTGGGAPGYMSYGVTNSDAPFYQTEAQRQSINNEFLSRYGLSADVGYRVWNEDGTLNTYKPLGSDGTGGVFAPDGQSSNPYYLQYVAGVDRSQLTGAAATASDRAIRAALRMDTQMLFGANDLYVTSDGWVSNAPTAGSTSVRAIRDDVLTARGMPTTQNTLYGQFAAEASQPTPLTTPYSLGYTGGSATGRSTAGGETVTSATADSGNALFDAIRAAGGKDITQLAEAYARLTSALGGDADTSAAVTGAYNTSAYTGAYGGSGFGSFGGIGGSQVYSASAYSDGAESYSDASGLEAQISAILQPQLQAARKSRTDLSSTAQAELEADAYARGMGGSSYISSLKLRETQSLADDLDELDTQYAAIVAERLYEAMQAQSDRDFEMYKLNSTLEAERQINAENNQNQIAMLNAKLKAEAQNTALGYAYDWYENWQKSNTASRSRSSSSSSSKSNRKTYTSDYYESYLKLLSPYERYKLSVGDGDYWGPLKAEIVEDIGDDGFSEILAKFK